jgi:polyisoprenoid-binding protein YceI
MTTATQPAISTWTIDPTHSTVEFSVKHMMISTVKGRFRDFEGTARIDDDDPSASSVSASVDVSSIDTGQEQRDAHLRSDDFFNADLFPKLTFVSTGIERVDDDSWKLAGALTMRDATRPVVFDVEFEGRGNDPWGKERAGFLATTKINRGDYGINFNGLMEAGGVVVGDSVKITLNLELIREN